jgi:hypothetical protein
MANTTNTIVTFHCEHAFWGDRLPAFPGYLSEPLCALSGLAMCYLGLKCSAGLNPPPLQFCLARASLVVCGLGTAVYHMLDQNVMENTRINGIMLDGVTMALVTVNIFLMHLSIWMKCRPMVISMFCMLYILFWVETNDMILYTYLSRELKVNGYSIISVGLQYPLFVIVYVYILARVLYMKGVANIWPMWLALAIALGSWGFDQFGCGRTNWFFIGHVVWHVSIGYVAVYLMVLGLMMERISGSNYYYEQSNTSRWWILLTEKKNDNSKNNLKAELDITSFFFSENNLIIKDC